MSWKLDWDTLKGDSKFTFTFRKLLQIHFQKVGLQVEDANSLSKDIVKDVLSNTMDISSFGKTFKKFLKDQNSCEEDKKYLYINLDEIICPKVLEALDHTMEIITCLKFDQLQKAYNSYADNIISETTKILDASVLQIPPSYTPKIFSFKQNMLLQLPVSDENPDSYRYDSYRFEKFAQGLIPQQLMILGYPIGHSRIDSIELSEIDDLKQGRHLNCEPNRLSFIYTIFIIYCLSILLFSLRAFICIKASHPRVDAIARFVNGNVRNRILS